MTLWLAAGNQRLGFSPWRLLPQKDLLAVGHHEWLCRPRQRLGELDELLTILNVLQRNLSSFKGHHVKPNMQNQGLSWLSIFLYDNQFSLGCLDTAMIQITQASPVSHISAMIARQCPPIHRCYSIPPIHNGGMEYHLWCHVTSCTKIKSDIGVSGNSCSYPMSLLVT